jgi:CBS domain-containing protein
MDSSPATVHAVVEDGRLVGVVTRLDLLGALAA